MRRAKKSYEEKLKKKLKLKKQKLKKKGQEKLKLTMCLTLLKQHLRSKGIFKKKKNVIKKSDF